MSIDELIVVFVDIHAVDMKIKKSCLAGDSSE